MNILLTGSDGYIGKAFYQTFHKKFDILKWDIKQGGDIFSTDIEESAIRGADVVIHLAAETSVTESFKKPQQYFYTNLLGTARIAQLCHKYKKKLIYPSTPCVEDPQSSPYAESKFLAEEILKPFLLKDKITILRFENVYGGEMKKGTLLYNFTHDKQLSIYGDGKQKRDFVHIDYIVDIIKAAISPKWNGLIVEVGTGNPISVNEIAQVFQKLTNKRIVYKEDMPMGMPISYANTTLLDKFYGKKQKYTLKQFIREQIEL